MACDLPGLGLVSPAALAAWVAVVAAACSSTGGKPVTPTALTVSDYEPARGAARLWPSPDGKFVAAELIFTGDQLPAVIKVIERAAGKVVAHARGSVVAGPDNHGEVLYVALDDRSHPVLRSTARAELAAALPPAPGEFARWTGFRFGASHDRVAVLRQDGDGATIAVVGLPGAAELATRRVPSSELELLAAAVSPTDDLLYLSGKTGGGGAVVALDGGTLRERWRVAWPDGHGFDDHPALGVTGDGGTVAAFAPSGLFAIDARRGTGARMVDFKGLARVALVGAPGRPVLVALRTFQQSPETPSYTIEAIELPSGQRTTLRPDTGPPNPAAIAVIGTVVLVAPGAPPRSAADQSTWGPELDGFVGK